MAGPSTGPRLRPTAWRAGAETDRSAPEPGDAPGPSDARPADGLGRRSRRLPESRLSLPQGARMTEPRADRALCLGRGVDAEAIIRRPGSRCSRLRSIDKTETQSHEALRTQNFVYARQASGKSHVSIYSIIYLMRITDWGIRPAGRCNVLLLPDQIAPSSSGNLDVRTCSMRRRRLDLAVANDRPASGGGPASRAMPDQSDDGSCSVGRRPVARTRGPLGGPSPDFPRAWLTAVQPLRAGSRSRLAHRAISANTPQPR